MTEPNRKRAIIVTEHLIFARRLCDEILNAPDTELTARNYHDIKQALNHLIPIAQGAENETKEYIMCE